MPKHMNDGQTHSLAFVRAEIADGAWCVRSGVNPTITVELCAEIAHAGSALRHVHHHGGDNRSEIPLLTVATVL